jgi:hypothetical protein
MPEWHVCETPQVVRYTSKLMSSLWASGIGNSGSWSPYWELHRHWPLLIIKMIVEPSRRYIENVKGHRKLKFRYKEDDIALLENPWLIPFSSGLCQFDYNTLSC